MARSFSITFDYLCPFARNANEAVVEGIRGQDWDVEFRPFSLSQTKVGEGQVPVWDRQVGDDGTSGVLALLWGLAVRDWFPQQFLDYHLGVFAARHEEGLDINDDGVLRQVAASVGLDPKEVGERVASGDPLDRLAEEHREAVKRWKVFGVPTLIEGDEAVFVRLMERQRLDDLEQTLQLIPWTRLNEFKRTSIPR
ncbi:MAG: DsbA family protein [Actinomycetota bacterium]|nr:DsbA family protein [Actinomycetota bacterium]